MNHSLWFWFILFGFIIFFYLGSNIDFIKSDSSVTFDAADGFKWQT